MKKLHTIFATSVIAVCLGLAPVAVKSAQLGRHRASLPSVGSSISSAAGFDDPLVSADAAVCPFPDCPRYDLHNHECCRLSDCLCMEIHEHGGVFYCGHDRYDCQLHYNCEVNGCQQHGDHSHPWCQECACYDLCPHTHHGGGQNNSMGASPGDGTCPGVVTGAGGNSGGARHENPSGGAGNHEGIEHGHGGNRSGAHH